MNFIDLCIERPILTLMLTLSMIVFGLLGYRQLGVDHFGCHALAGCFHPLEQFPLQPLPVGGESV